MAGRGGTIKALILIAAIAALSSCATRGSVDEQIGKAGDRISAIEGQEAGAEEEPVRTVSIRPNDAEDPNMVAIGYGWFWMGTSSGEVNEEPEHEVFLETFKIDIYEVNAEDFAAFLNEKGNPEDKYFAPDKYSTIIGFKTVDGKRVKTVEDPEEYMARLGYENYPANNVSWYGADAYCSSVGKRLPTESEWEKAARSEDRRIYPWGNTMPDSTKARYGQLWDDRALKVMVPVDALPSGVSPYGAFNMAGNVWEWVNDWYRTNYCYYCEQIIGDDDIVISMRLIKSMKSTDKDEFRKELEESEETSPRENPMGPSFGNFKVLRGGSWYDSYGSVVIRSTFRYWFLPKDKYINFGFRCALDKA